jgi:hypothetical protein
MIDFNSEKDDLIKELKNKRKKLLEEIRDNILSAKGSSIKIGIPNIWQSQITGGNPWDEYGEKYLSKINKEIEDLNN